MRRSLRWDGPETPRPRRPYRDTILLHLALAALIVVGAVIGGRGLGRGLAWAFLFFVVATSWALWQWRRRLAAERRAEL